MEPTHEERLILPRQFLRVCRAQKKVLKVVDSTGIKLTGEQLLLRTLIVRRLLGRILGADEKFVGLLLPPSVPAVVANAAIPLLGRVAVNLNYTVSSAIMKSCIAQCNIRHVLTSRRVLEKFKFEFDDNVKLVYLEDFKEQIRWTDKVVAATQAFVTPLGILERQFGLTKIGGEDLMTVIFTSGSTGEPKGVMLSHNNVGSNVAAVNEIVQLRASDTLLGILPFFHAFGFTVTLWTVLSLPPKGAYHFSPLDAHIVGKLCRENGGTILIGTPTFLRTYLRRCGPEDFKTLDVVFTGAEKLPRELADAFEAKFGVRPNEGYGATETSPVAAGNIPATRTARADGPSHRDGSVGRPIPGLEAKVINPDTSADLPTDTPGMLLLKGPAIMQGYLNKPEQTAKVIRDGWYVTGDIAKIDADGFIQITDRASRFSKIGGEMVPHIRVEELLQKLLTKPGEDEGELRAVVTAVPDERKGERLIVVHTVKDLAPEQICKSLSEHGLPNLFIPSPDSFLLVEEIPHLGTGKVDLKGLKQLALEKFGGK